MTGWNFKDWYEDNKQDFNKQRRSRYHTDPEYRARVLAMNRNNREKRQKVRFQEDKERKKAVKMTPAPAFKEVEFKTADGQIKKLLTIQALAKTLGRSAQSIRLWEKEGTIPATPHRNKRGLRLYTPEQIIEIAKLVTDLKGPPPPARMRVEEPVDLNVRFADGSEKVVQAFRVGVLAKAANRSVLTLEQMERKGTFPGSPLRAPGSNHRYFTVAMIEAVVEAFDALGGIRLRGDSKKEEFRGRVEASWKDQGILEATVLSYAVKSTGESNVEEVD